MTTLKEEMDLVLYEVDENRMENPNARINTEDEAGWTLARLAALNADIEEIKKTLKKELRNSKNGSKEKSGKGIGDGKP